MRRIASGFLSLLLIGGAMAGDTIWSKHTDKKGGYSASFPGTPRPIKRDIAGGGLKATMYGLGAEWKDGAVLVGWFDLPPELVTTETTAAIFDGAVKEIGSKPGTKMLRDVEFTFNGLPGRSIQLVRDGALVDDYIILKGSRLYQVLGIRAVDKPQSAFFKQFFDSFTLAK